MEPCFFLLLSQCNKVVNDRLKRINPESWAGSPKAILRPQTLTSDINSCNDILPPGAEAYVEYPESRFRGIESFAESSSESLCGIGWPRNTLSYEISKPEDATGGSSNSEALSHAKGELWLREGMYIYCLGTLFLYLNYQPCCFARLEYPS